MRAPYSNSRRSVSKAWTSVTSKPSWLDELFPLSAASHIVKNSVGDIHEDETVGNLRATYSSLSQVVAKMLKIEAAQATTPAHSGANNLTISTSNADVKCGDTFPSNITVVFNRGSWNAGTAFEPDGTTVTDLFPHNPGAFVTLDGEFGFTNASVFHGDTFTDSSQEEITFTSGSITGTFNNWRDYNLTASMTTSSTSTGTVYNNYGLLPTQGPVSQSFPLPQQPQQRTWRVYKPLYVDNVEVTSDAKGTSGTAGFSNEFGTVKVFSSTNEIIVTNHAFSDKIRVPFTPANVYEYVNFGDTSGWYAEYFTYEAVTVSTYGSYHEITLTTPRTLNVDVKITK